MHRSRSFVDGMQDAPSTCNDGLPCSLATHRLVQFAIGATASIVLIMMLMQAAVEAGGKLAKPLVGVLFGLVAVSFIVGLVGLVWQLADPWAWMRETDSIAAMARIAVRGIGRGAHFINQGSSLWPL